MDSLRRKIHPRKNIPTEISLRSASTPIRFFVPPKSTAPFGGPKKIATLREYSPQRRGSSFRFFSWIAGSILLIFVLFFGYFSWKIGGATRAMSIVPSKSTPASDTIRGANSLLAPLLRHRTLLPGERDGRTNILLLGKANEKTAGQKLTDTIMIASFDFSRKKIALLSLPRDLYVEIPETNMFTKLNALYQIDMENDTRGETVKEAVSNITGLPIHAFAALDYDGFIKMVDLLGGVSVYVDRDLFDPHFPGPNYSYETFKIDKGWHDLPGETALKYVRERHGDPEGDFGRAKRQQAILSAMKNKVFSIKTILNPVAISGIIDTLGEHIRTDLSLEDIQSLAGLANEFDTANITTVVVDAWKKDSLLRVSHVPVGQVAMFVLLPRTGDWSEIRELAETIFDRDREKARKEAIAHEDAHIAIVNDSDSPALGARVARFLTENLDIQPTRVVLAFNKKQESMQERATRETSVIIRRGGTEAIYTTDEISKKFSLPIKLSDTEANFSPEYISEDTSPKNFNITILLGNDLAKRLSFEEDTPEDIQNAESDLEYQRRLDTALSEENK